VLGGFGAGGWVAYPNVRARILAAKTTATAALAAPSLAAPEEPPHPSAAPPVEEPKWMTAIEDGQQLLAGGDGEGALRKFKEAVDGGGGAVARSFFEQAKLGTAVNGPCRMTALSHPRFGYGGNAGRPAVAVTSKGAVVAWTDDHEQPGHDHVYSVTVDDAGRPTSPARDLTPEADVAMRPELLTVGHRVVLLFWDKTGRQPGVKARWLDADGRINGMSVEVSASKAGLFWPSMAPSPDGSGFWVAWQANPDKEGDDIFLRHLDAELAPLGSEIRATDYEPFKNKPTKASVPTVAVSATNVFVAYTLERDRQSSVERLRIPVSAPELQGSGLSDKAAAKGQRQIGEALAVNDDKVGGDYPGAVCTKDACFIVWHEIDKGGAESAMIDPARGTLLWRKRFAPKGGHPAVAAGPEGDAEVVFYETGRVRVASISRDGVGAVSTFARTTGDQPRAWIAPGRGRGEWWVSWLDVEAGRTEPFLTRLECRH
jgi:serine/threonine-protein kinase